MSVAVLIKVTEACCPFIAFSESTLLIVTPDPYAKVTLPAPIPMTVIVVPVAYATDELGGTV